METKSFLKKYGFRSLNTSETKWVLGVFYISYEKPGQSRPGGKTIILRKNLTKKSKPEDKISNCLYKGAYLFDNEELVKWLFFKIGITNYADNMETGGRLSHHVNIDFYHEGDQELINRVTA